MRNLICRIRGHDILCTQEAVLTPDGRAILHHYHVCRRCNRRHEYGTEELSPEWAAMLQNEVEVTGIPVVVNLDPPYRHAGRQ